VTAPALSSLADALSLLADQAPSHARELLALASLDADEVAKATEAVDIPPALLLAIQEDAQRLERDGERLGLALGPGIAAMIRTTLRRA
jgi:hypothetical protein